MKARVYAGTQRREIWVRDRGHCIYCGRPGQVIDHVIPSSYGGPTWKANGVLACRRCNSKKKGSFDMEFLVRGIFWLNMQGEDTEWMNDFQPKYEAPSPPQMRKVRH